MILVTISRTETNSCRIASTEPFERERTRGLSLTLKITWWRLGGCFGWLARLAGKTPDFELSPLFLTTHFFAHFLTAAVLLDASIPSFEVPESRPRREEEVLGEEESEGKKKKKRSSSGVIIDIDID